MLKSVGDTIMQERFRMFCRAGGNFYTRDKITARSESLGTADRATAKQLLAARNQAAAQPQLNRTMAKAYLSAKSPDLLTRTWADVMEHYSVTGVESTRKRKATAFRSRPFILLRGITLMDTEAGHLLAVLQHERAGGVARCWASWAAAFTPTAMRGHNAHAWLGCLSAKP
jgi:hypothetical protein